ncbi:golvesin C-terminal-like domain-containing protein [Streptomyces sp. NPDC002537]
MADKKDGYSWRTAATLKEPGFDADMWIGNACVTGSGQRAVVAYAPRTFTNHPELMARGAFTAVVDLSSGSVTKLDRQASLAYFSPGCGTGENAVFTVAGGEDKNATRLITIDAATGRLDQPIEVKGQVTSAVPVGGSIVAADAARLVKINKSGQRTSVARTNQIPFLLKPDADGGLVYMDRPTSKDGAPLAAQGEVKRVSATDLAREDDRKTKPAVLAKGTLARMDLASSADGQVFITGDTKAASKMPTVVRRRTDVPKESIATTRGEALVSKTAWADGKDSRVRAPGAVSATRPVQIDLKVLGTDKEPGFRITPGASNLGNSTQGDAPSPALKQSSAVKKQGVGRSAVTDEDQRYCSVPRNDPAKQAIQPKPRQVEWAVDQAITGNLNKLISRPENWRNLGMAAYQPQTLFPPVPLDGGGRIPAQVMLGVTAQESNMWQASRVVVPGVAGNPLIGNYYGIKYAANGQQTDPWGINWDKADCGYGVTQVTDGMRMHGKEKPGETALTGLQQEAVALDYATNISAGIRILADKWNQTRRDGLTINNGKPQYIENWYFALWAYNSGYYPKDEAGKNGGMWGVGFTNNPANPLWKANRTPFLESPDGKDDYKQAAHPQDWPYQEKIMGWAARPLEALESPGKMVSGFRQAGWTTPKDRTAMKAPEGTFCTSANQCDPSKIGPNDKNEPGLGACTRDDLKCWWNQPASWKNCDRGAQCGQETLRFNDTYVEEAWGDAYPPTCSTDGLPSNALIVDDVPDSTPTHRPGCTPAKKSSGKFSLDFASDSAQIDFQQLGAGYGGHFWFAHTRKDDADGQRMKVTGTWEFTDKISSAAKVFVHIPDHGAYAQQVTYVIDTARGKRRRTIKQNGNGGWVSLGAFKFDGAPKVQLDTLAANGTGDADVAFDAVAVAPGDYAVNTVDIKLPAEDPNAPDIDFPDEPTSTPSSGKKGLASPKTKNCTVVDPKTKKSLCIELRQTSPTAEGRRALAAAAPGDGFVTWCPTYMGRHFTRYEGCIQEGEAVVALVTADGMPLGSATFAIRQDIKLYPNSSGFSESMYFVPTKIDDALGPFTLDWEGVCKGKCTDTKSQWIGSPAYTSATDLHSSEVWRSHQWTGTSSDEMTLSWKMWANTPRGQTTTSEWDAQDFKIRCDNQVGASSGCVFPNHTSTFTLNTAKYPSAAAYYWILQEKLASHPGSEKYNKPLHRLADDDAAQKNRDKVCDSSFEPHPDTPETSCDEYPFAKSQESGGQLNISSGKECVQMYTSKGSDGSWRLYDDDRYAPPTWNEVCGRANIPKGQNTGAGGDLGRFTTKFRLLDGDAYWVHAPGF